MIHNHESFKLFWSILRSLVKKPATRSYPNVPITPADGYRGKQVLYIDRCIGCGLCSKDCPAAAITMVEFEDGKKKPMFNLSRCIFCYLCAEGCPRNSIEFTKEYSLATNEKNELMLDPRINGLRSDKSLGGKSSD